MVSSSDQAASAVQRSLHPNGLLRREHHHRTVVNVVHVVHEHVPARAISATDARKFRFAEVGTGGVRCVSDKVASTAVFSVATNVTKVKPVPDFVRGRSPE